MNSPTPYSPRPVWQLVFLGTLLGAWLAFYLATEPRYYFLNSETKDAILVPVEVQALAASDALPEFVIFTISSDGALQRATTEIRAGGRSARAFRVTTATREILLAAPPDVLDDLQNVTVRLGPQSYPFDGPAFREQWRAWEGEVPGLPSGSYVVRRFPAEMIGTASLLPAMRGVVNYCGDGAVVRKALGSPLFLGYAVCFGLVLLFRLTRPSWLNGPSALPALLGAEVSPAPAGRSWFWPAVGLGVMLGCLALLEWQQPYYFCQDDNFAQFLPGILHGCRTVLTGEFPSWNPLQYLGAPLAEVGTYALTYPLTYVSYALARFVLHDEYQTLEVFCGLHLLLGFLAHYWLGRRLDLSAALAAAFGLCVVLSGFALIGGRSWYYMTPVFVWAPLLVVAVLSLRRSDPGWRWTLGTALVIGLFFHAGNVQMWTYALGLTGVVVLWSWAQGAIPRRRLVLATPAAILGLGLAAVLLVPQFLATRQLHREGGLGGGIGEGIAGLFFPYPVAQANHPNCWGTSDADLMGQFYYAGSLFTLVWLAAVLAATLRLGGVKLLLKNPLFAASLLAFVLSLGPVGLLWTAQAKLPVLKQFNSPFKFLPYFHLFACAGGALVLHRWLQRRAAPRWVPAMCFVMVAGLLGYHALLARPAFYSYSEQPYPALTEELAALHPADGGAARVLPLALGRSQDMAYVAGLRHQFPTIYGVNCFTGYDPLVEEELCFQQVVERYHDDPHEAVRRYGVTHCILHRSAELRPHSGEKDPDEVGSLFKQRTALATDLARNTADWQDDAVRVYAVRNADPLAFRAAEPARALPVQVLPASVNVELDGTTQGPVVVNYLWRPGMEVRGDGGLLPAGPDEWDRIRVDVPAGTRQLTVRYTGRWKLGLLAALGLSGGGLASFGFLRRRLRLGRAC